VDKETRQSLIILGVTGAFFGFAWLARGALGIEWSAESVREGPIFFVLLTGFRSFLLVPSQIMLVAAGLCFGAGMGTVYGALGLMVSGCVAFGLARWVGREAVLANVPENMRWAFSAAGSGAGATVVLVGTAYPVGPITAFHAGAGLTAMAIPIFLLALASGSVVRAAVYAYFGSALGSKPASAPSRAFGDCIGGRSCITARRVSPAPRGSMRVDCWMRAAHYTLIQEWHYAQLRRNVPERRSGTACSCAGTSPNAGGLGASEDV
jgi:uncharacterized membrane protein YdjX (TVP38/TMEM64 family)